MSVRKGHPAVQTAVIPKSFVLKGRTFRGLDALPAREARRLYQGLMQYGNACGCDEGALGVLLSVGLYLLGSAFVPMWLARPVTVAWPWGVAAALAGGVLGKCLGLWRAHRRFEGLRHQFEALTKGQATIEGLTADPNQTGGMSHG
jgi:hypothetical protein